MCVPNKNDAAAIATLHFFTSLGPGGGVAPVLFCGDFPIYLYHRIPEPKTQPVN